MSKDTLWWRLIHLEPALVRGVLTGAVGLAGALGILGLDWLPDKILGLWVPLVALVQVLITRPAVTANARVVVAAPDPIGSPTTVVAGEAVTKASPAAIVDAARELSRG